MAMFGKKEASPAPSMNTTPIDEVLRMRQQGLSNNQIVQALQRNGYQTHQIFDAMNQADLRSGAPIQGAVPPEEAQQPAPEPQKESPIPESPMPEAPAAEEQYDTTANIEEVAEAIIEEKWEDLVKQHEKLLEWKDTIDQRTTALAQEVTDLSKQFSSVQQAVLGKSNEYDKTMRTVSADMKAMENVFEKLLPALTENVAELRRLTKKSKKKK